MDSVETLTFFSWWFEGKTKKYLTLTYSLRGQQLSAAIDGLSGEHEVPSPKTRAGTDVECWDLFVGSEISVLGKAVVLKQCDNATWRWIEYYGRNLMAVRGRQVREKLETTLRKYDIRPLSAWLHQPAESPVQGGINLRLLQKQCKELKERLEHFRPKLAAAILTEGILAAN